jgi:hypothetical protein
MRDNLQAAIDAGVSAIFTDADSIYWQSRLESDSAGVRDRILVCYKDASEDPDSSNPDTSADTTVEFREPPVNWPEEPLIGLMFNHNSELGVSGDVVISDDSNWIFAGTGLRNGDHLAHFLGPEVDSSHGHSPAATDIVAESPFQSTIGSGVAEMSVYRARSGAYVFDSGTSRFNYGLDDFYDLALDFSPNLVGLSTNPRGSPEVQQMVRNLLSRMGARY